MLESAETTFQQDLNGDGTIGPTKTVIQTDGSTTLTAVANEYFLYGSSGSGPALQYQGAPVIAGHFTGWTPIGAVQTANGYEVAWNLLGTKQYTVWRTDANGNFVSDTIGVVLGSSYTLESFETTFQQDLNSDGTIGPTKTVIQTDGSTTLTAVANEYFLYGSSGSGPALQYQGAPVIAGQFAGWTPIGAVQTAKGYEVAWNLARTNQYTVWNTASNGNFVSDIGVVSGSSYTLESLETTFQQDLNGDGTIGPTRPLSQTGGLTTLSAVANQYSLYGSSGSGPTLQYQRAPLTASQSAVHPAMDPVQPKNGCEMAWNLPGPATFVGSSGTLPLELDQSCRFSGTVAGLASEHTIDFDDMCVHSPMYSGTHPTRSAVLDDVHTASSALLQNYLASAFVDSNGGHEWTCLVGPVLTGSNHEPILTHPQHSIGT